MQHEGAAHRGSSDEETEAAEESLNILRESQEESEREESVNEDVLEDIERFEQTFHNITHRYKLINRIGEGTFSTVYKAEDLLYDHYENSWDNDANEIRVSTHKRPTSRFVAIKKIYVTSSPQRILNELELLHDLRNAPNVSPLITALRCHDQVVAILPYFAHQDFREYYRSFTVSDMQVYFHSLFTALDAVHNARIIHRDIKPTNFLYSPTDKRGVLVDFGLAEREGTDYHPCPCTLDERQRKHRVNTSVYASMLLAAQETGTGPPRTAYPANEQRSSRRANRAGTRGFRAPEVLLKCTAQSCLIDIWSCGIMLLTFLAHRFPFFHSADDIDAFIELSTIFGRKRMRETALLHGQVFHTNIPTISNDGHTWERVLLWCTQRSKKNQHDQQRLTDQELDAVDFMTHCLELDPSNRITASEALLHPWLAAVASPQRSDELLA